jgi:uncharacterized protein YjbI with pentapeptide repeats
MSNGQRAALLGIDVVWSYIERLIRWRSKWPQIPVGRLARLAVELVIQRRYPRVRRSVAIGHLVGQGTAAVSSSRQASLILQRQLMTRPAPTLRSLAWLELLVRMTHSLHGERWSLPLRSAELRSLTLDGGVSGMLERACFAHALLLDVRFFGSLGSSDFDRACLRGVSFIGCFFGDATLRGATLTDVVVASSEASRCSFERAIMSRCTLVDTSFRRCNFVGARLEEVVFEGCDLTGADIRGTSWHQVEFVDCILDESLAGLRTVTVNDRRRRSGARPGMTVFGAVPRSMARLDGATEAHSSIVVRYSGGSSKSRPPVGYRLQTLARQLTTWVSAGSNYPSIRRKALREDEALALAFPRSRVWGALRTLAGWDTSGANLVYEVPYRNLVAAVRERHPAVRTIALPQLVVVDGDYPLANYIDFGDERYIVLSNGLIVMTIRLARYCIAWTYPSAVSYMDEWPRVIDEAAMRAALTENLRRFARSRGDLTRLGRVQLAGMRDMQSLQLGQTFMYFVLGHELGHFLQAVGILASAGSHFDAETQADVLAARLLMENGSLDGDAELIEMIGSLTPEEIRQGYTFVRFTLKQRGLQVPPALSAEELEALMGSDPSSEAFLEGLARFASCDWYAAAIAAFIVALGGSTGYHGIDDVMLRVTSVVGEAFGESVAAEVASELADEGTVLNMLRVAFDDQTRT